MIKVNRVAAVAADVVKRLVHDAAGDIRVANTFHEGKAVKANASAGEKITKVDMDHPTEGFVHSLNKDS